MGQVSRYSSYTFGTPQFLWFGQLKLDCCPFKTTSDSDEEEVVSALSQFRSALLVVHYWRAIITSSSLLHSQGGPLMDDRGRVMPVLGVGMPAGVTFVSAHWNGWCKGDGWLQRDSVHTCHLLCMAEGTVSEVTSRGSQEPDRICWQTSESWHWVLFYWCLFSVKTCMKMN